MKIKPLSTSPLIHTVLFIMATLFSSSAISANLISHNVEISAQLHHLEKEAKGRLGLYLIDPSDDAYFSYRGDERFPFCSTSKILVVSKLLHDSQRLPHVMASQIMIRDSDLTNYNPITGQKVGGTMSVAALSQAALQYSDNTAMNLLLQKAGGINAINIFARSLGDTIFSLTRNEPTLNTSIPGDVRDSTSPHAMALTLQQLTLGSALQKDQRDLLVSWMKGNTTGNNSIKAGVPVNWTVGDKTGTGDYGTTNDVAVIWTNQGKPLILVVYFTQFKKDAASRKDIIAKAAKRVTSYLQ